MVFLTALLIVLRPHIASTLVRVRFTIALERARGLADDPQLLGFRLTESGENMISAASQWIGSRNRYDVAEELLSLSQRIGANDAHRGAGTAYLLAGRPVHALASLESIPEKDRLVSDWADLGAAHALAAKAEGDESWLRALAAVDRALMVDPAHPQARSNRALIVRVFGVAPLERRAWTTVLSVEKHRPWNRVAHARLRALPASEAEMWKVESEVERLTPETLAALTRRFPQLARTYAEGPYLSQWAEATLRGDEVAARGHLARVRIIGTVLLQEGGDSIVVEAVETIDRSRNREVLAHAHILYKAGRQAFARHDDRAGERDLREAARKFSATHSPMRTWAMIYLASAVLQQGRVAEAGVLHRQIEAETKPTHRAAAARLLLETALREGMQGHWSASLGAALRSMSISRVLRERGNTAAAEAIVSANYDFLGQPALARQHGFAALADAAAAGDFERTRVILGALSRTELRGRHWRWAHAVQQLEIELADVHHDPGLDADLWMARAACESRLSHRRAAADALSRARVSARRVPSPTRDRLLADIDGIEGTLIRTEDPHRAWTLLSSAIVFQKRATRPILLPQLYLARGRTALHLGRIVEAGVDFENGIHELERQRAHVDDAALRPGIFDDATELFDEALSLQLQLDKDPSAALTIVERSRARTLLEQMSARPDVRRLSVAEIQRRLNRTTAIVEFATLPDRIVTFVITRDGVIHHQTIVPRDRVYGLTTAFLSNLSSGREITATRDNAVALYDLTIAPVVTHLAGTDHVVIIPDHPIERIPFAALFDRDSKSYLIERFTISTAPSASVFATIVERGPIRRPSSITIFANPLAKDSGRFPPLHAAEIESRMVSRAYSQTRLITGLQATAEQFLKAAPEADVLHFAGHAYVNHSMPAESALVLSDNVVTVREIARMNFSRTHAIILAACSTMRGRNAAVEGVPSLANAFLSAGAAAVIGTLWDINDGAAAPVIALLHREISAGATPAEALRAAQTEAIRAGHPVAQWAAFAVTGAGRRQPIVP